MEDSRGSHKSRKGECPCPEFSPLKGEVGTGSGESNVLSGNHRKGCIEKDPNQKKGNVSFQRAGSKNDK